MSRHRGQMRGMNSSSRGSWGGGSRGSSWGGRGSSWGGRGSYSSRGGGGSSRFESYSNSFEGRSKYSSSTKRNSGSRNSDEFRKPYRGDTSYSSREGGHRSPERKRPRNEAPSSRHDSSYGGYGSSRYESSYADRRSFSSDRHPTPFSRRDDFRRPSGPPRGGYRGRISSRGSRGLKLRDRLPPRRRLNESSYAVRKRIISSRSIDHARRLKISKMRSAIAARHAKKESSDKESEEEKDKKEQTKNEGEKDTENDAKDEENETSTQNKSTTKESSQTTKEEKPDKSEEATNKKTFIKLNCPHCGIKAVTFRKYDNHLQSRTHILAMRRVAIKQKSILAQMRLAQRNAQNELEKTSDDLARRTNFCPLCKLNYKQRKVVHQNSEAHKNMKKFLMPYCKVCNITFKSPMIYESHCCSIEHLKRKQRVENGDNSDEYDDENLDNFTTIDSVGIDGDASEDEDPKEVVNLGIDQIRKVEAYYCDLCKMYVGRGSEDVITSILARHCKQRTHLQRFKRLKEEQEKQAEKVKKEKAEDDDEEKEADVSSKSENTTSKKAKTENLDDTVPAKDDDEARDDKLWADVDKDLDDILAKESGTKSSDEDEDVNGERYDRFKYSEKNGEEKKIKKDEDVKDSTEQITKKDSEDNK